MGSLQGKSALITGGASGIGEACGVRFAKEGAKVISFDLHNENVTVLKVHKGDIEDETSTQLRISISYQRMALTSEIVRRAQNGPDQTDRWGQRIIIGDRIIDNEV